MTSWRSVVSESRAVTPAEPSAGPSRPPETSGAVNERQIEVRRTARYAVLGRTGPELRQIWVACHGYRQLARRFARYFEPIDDGRRLVVAPEGLSRFYIDDPGGRHTPDHRVGASWMTREDREAEIRDYVRYLNDLLAHIIEPIDRADVEVVALGFSQGVATVCRWIASGQQGVDRLVLWGDTLPPDVDFQATSELFADLALTLVFGTDEPHVSDEAVERDRARLEAAGIPPHRVLRFEGGHRLDREVLARLAEASPTGAVGSPGD